MACSRCLVLATSNRFRGSSHVAARRRLPLAVSADRDGLSRTYSVITGIRLEVWQNVEIRLGQLPSDWVSF
jgi:hypothetical protein